MKKKEKLFMAVTLALCVLLFLQGLTGEIGHAVFGILLSILVIVHMCRQITKMKYKKMPVQIADWVLMAALAVLFLTGMLLHPLQGALIIKILHKLAAVIFVLGIFVHIAQHRKVKQAENLIAGGEV